MKKKLILICASVLVVVLALFAFTACDAADETYGEELVQDGAFSSFVTEEGNNHFSNWEVPNDFPGTYSHHDLGNNEYALRISNSSAAYSYLFQRVKVEVNKVYKISVDINVEKDLNRDNGAHVTFLENTGWVFAGVRNSTNGFVTKTFYVKPKNTDYLTIALCLGAETQGVSGAVLFDNVTITKVDPDTVPEDAEVANFRKVRTFVSAEDVKGICFVTLLTLFSVAAVLVAYYVVKRIYARRNAFTDFADDLAQYAKKGVKTNNAAKAFRSSAFIACALALVTFGIRAILLFTTYGFGTEMTNLIGAGRNMYENGVWNYLQNNPSSTLAPGAMYILTVIGAASVNLSNASASILIRLVNVLADIAVVLLIFYYGKKKVGNKLSTVYAALYAALPFVFVMSGMNGTFESVLTLLLLIAVICMIDKQYLATYLTMTLAAVLDLRALAIAPIIVAYFVYCYIKDNDNLRKFTSKRAQIIFGLIATIPLAYLLTLPVGIHQIANGDAFFNFKVLVNEMQGTTYFVANAFNLYGMVAMNGKTLNTSVSILNFVFLLVLEAYVVSLYFKNRNKQELILLVSFVLAMAAVFTVKVNYTYLFLSIVFGLIYTMVSGERRVFGIVASYAALGFLDVAQLLNQSGLITTSATTNSVIAYETTSPFYIIFCVLTVLLTGYYVYVVYSITNNSKIADIPPMADSLKNSVKKFFAGARAKKAAN